MTPGKTVALHNRHVPFFHPGNSKNSSLTSPSDSLLSLTQLEKEFLYMIIRCHCFTVTRGKIVPFHNRQVPLFHPENWNKSSLTWSSDITFSPWELEKWSSHDHPMPFFHPGSWKHSSLTWSSGAIFYTDNWKNSSLTKWSDATFSPLQLEKEFPYIFLRCHCFTVSPGEIVPLHNQPVSFFHFDNWKQSSLTSSSDIIFSPWQLEK